MRASVKYLIIYRHKDKYSISEMCRFFSVSRRGNPYDNAMAENFFSILKSECINRIKLQTFEDARKIIDEYIYFYNNERLQLKTKLTPQEMRCQYVA